MSCNINRQPFPNLFIIAVIMALLTGCPMSSNPTKEQQPSSPGASTLPASTPPSAAGSGSSRSDNTGASSNALPSSPSASAPQPSADSGQRQSHRHKGSSHSQSTQTSGDVVDASDPLDPSAQVVGGDGADMSGDNSATGAPASDEQQEPDLTDQEPVMAGASQQQWEPDLTDQKTAAAASAGAEQASAQQSQNSNTQSSASGAPPNSAGSRQSSTAPSTSGSAASSSASRASATISGGGTLGAMTTGEQVAVLDRELAKSTGRFDQMILRERENIRNNARQKGGTTAGSGGDEFESLDETVGAAGDALPGNIDREGGSRGERDTGTPAQVATYAPPADIPDGNDDDVVARQLREAAMKEPNPKLREKLWEEYRKYKGVKQ